MDKNVKTSVKQKAFDRDKIASKHRGRAQKDLNARREESRKRVRGTIVSDIGQASDIVTLMQKMDIQQFLSQDDSFTLDALHKIMCTGSLAQPFFGPTELYREYKGPFLFTDQRVLQRLIQLVSIGNQKAAECMTCVVGYPTPETWVRVVENMGLLDIIKSHVSRSDCPQALRKECWWMLSNMSCDNTNTRNHILAMDFVTLMNNQPLQDEVIFVEAAIFVKTLFDRAPVPTEDVLQAVWPFMTQVVQRCKVSEDLYTAAAQFISNLGRYMNVDCHLWLLRTQKDVIYIMQDAARSVPNPAPMVEAMAKLCYHVETHEILVMEYKALDFFAHFMQNYDLNTRLVALKGVRSLSQNEQCVGALLTEEFFWKAFWPQFSQSDSWVIRSELFWILAFLCKYCPPPLQDRLYTLVTNQLFNGIVAADRDPLMQFTLLTG